MLYNDPDTMDIPVIIVSPAHRTSDRVWNHGRGAAEHVTGPFGNREFIDKPRSLHDL